MSWLLDTCVLSEWVRPRPKASVVRWVRERDEDDLFLSVLTIGELEKGIAKLPDSSKRAILEQWVRRELADRFRGRLLAIASRIAARCGTLVGASEAHGQPLPVIDSLIAATSLQDDLQVVARNTEELERCESSCVNPWVEK
ncbi:MAG: type II toxin-antitoxin system VapC family toxin [Betaproteobacteria bacterium]